jgi:hypothetical protein
MNPAMSLSYNSGFTTTNLRLSSEENVSSETPLANQNEAFAEQSATRMPVPDMDIGTQLLQIMRHDTNIDPLQNELSALRKSQKSLTGRHNEKVIYLQLPFLGLVFIVIIVVLLLSLLFYYYHLLLLLFSEFSRLYNTPLL